MAAELSGDRLLDQWIVDCRPTLAARARQRFGRSYHSKVDASDVVQETILRAINSKGQFRGQSKGEFTAWIRSILERCQIDVFRRFMTHGREVARESTVDEMGIATTNNSPSSMAIRREKQETIARALEQLSLEHRRVIVLRDFEELAWPEVARRMKRTPGAVRMLWTRALKSLQAHLSERL